MLKGYLAANLNDSDLVLEAVAFDVTTTVAVLNAPGVNPVILMVLSAVKLEILFVKTFELSASFVTVTATVTPVVGIVELTFTIIACEVPTTPKILPAPGSTFTEKAIEDSVGVTGGVVVVSPPLLHDDKIKGIATSKYLSVFIIIA
jgi:hypothetical protein